MDIRKKVKIKYSGPNGERVITHMMPLHAAELIVKMLRGINRKPKIVSMFAS